jgi:hypothetical protein
MPTFAHGKSTDFAIDDTGGTSRNISNTLTDVSFPQTIDTAETTAFGSSNKSYIVGLKDTTISVSGLWDATVDGYLSGTEPASRSFIFGPAGSTGGNVKYTGEAILTNYNQGNPVGDVVTFTADFQVTGAVTRGTY